MKHGDARPIPPLCPISGEPLYVSEITSSESGIVIRGKFVLPPTARLSPEQQQFLEVFLRARGVISTMEKELGVSYPTVKGRVDALLDALGMEPYKSERREPRAEDKARILKQLEAGEITAAEAKEQLKRSGAK